jgi:serine/threonine protein kinase
VHPTSPRDVAIKIAHEPEPVDRSLLKGDAKLLRDLNHPNLVHIYDLDVHDGRPFVAMELVRGRNLAEVSEQSRAPPGQAASWAAEIARALDYMHQCGIVHLDVEPRDILLDESGRPPLINFGMAGHRRASRGSVAAATGGMPAFTAPERARGERERAGEASDVVALGGVLYFLLTGKAPFGAGTGQERWRRASRCDIDRDALKVRGIPSRLERIVLKAIEAELEERYASPVEMARALEDYSGRHRGLAIEAAILLLAALSVIAWAWWLRPAPKSGRNPATEVAPPSKAVPIGGRPVGHDRPSRRSSSPDGRVSPSVADSGGSRRDPPSRPAWR